LCPEPSILDCAPNELILKVSFKELFAIHINQYLPDFLTMLYRFFGHCVTSIGLLLLTYVYVTRIGTRFARIAIYTMITIVLSGAYIDFSFYSNNTIFIWYL